MAAKASKTGAVEIGTVGAMKTPAEIFEEMKQVAEGCFGASLFVGFEDSSIILKLHHRTEVLSDGRVVYEIDPNFVPLLKDAIANGGVPIGWHRLKTRKTAGDTVELGPLQDQQREAWVYEYLKHFYGREDRKDGARYYLVYPDGNALDITDEES
jgi:hypothetical protein